MAKASEKQTAETISHDGFVDPVALGKILMDVSQKAQPLMQDFFTQNDLNFDDFIQDSMNLRPAYTEFLQHLYSDPQKLTEMQMQFWTEWVSLWQDSARRFMGDAVEDNYKPEKGDRRFKSDTWHDNPFFDFMMQSYLMTSRWIHDVVQETDGLDDDTRTKVDFYTQQFMNALAPSNFLLTNPDVLQETIDTHGENLLRGLQNLLEDLERGKGKLAISTTDYDAFSIGENIATTPGKVIYQNDLMQLIQYEATTKTVHKRPLLIVPPWINKFYILDLRPENSFIKWLTDQGHTVFTISWVNPNRELAKKRFEDYMEEGVFDALDQVKTVTGEPDCNVISYCLGGTLTAVTLAWLKAKKRDNRIASATFLTTLVDFEKAGEMKMFMDESQLKMMDKEMSEKGFLPADHMKKTFSMLRANDLVWSFVINNYLMGKEPFPFDLLYWNDDATNMPAAMHSFYMRQCYQQNKLVEPGGVTMNSVPIHIDKVETPCFFLSAREDHIAPWKATYATTQHFKGPVHFVLSASGHVAGVVNPPAANKYCYWTAGQNPAEPDDWFDEAAQHDGSWWPHWGDWIKDYTGGKQVPAREVGGGKLKPIEDAPGSYVKMKARD